MIKFNRIQRGCGMYREIDCIAYDTDKSTVDKKFTFGKPGDPDGYEETLYVTNEGKYFIYTNGGRLSKHPKETIIPIEREDVKVWMMSR